MCELVYDSAELINAVLGGFIGAGLSIPIALFFYRRGSEKAQKEFDKVWRAAASPF